MHLAFLRREFQFLCWSLGHFFLACKPPGAPLTVPPMSARGGLLPLPRVYVLTVQSRSYSFADSGLASPIPTPGFTDATTSADFPFSLADLFCSSSHSSTTATCAMQGYRARGRSTRRGGKWRALPEKFIEKLVLRPTTVRTGMEACSSKSTAGKGISRTLLTTRERGSL